MDLRIGAVQEADIVFSGTGHKHTGGTDGNTIGLDALQVDEQSAENAGAITLSDPGTGFTVIAALASMSVVADDRIIVLGDVETTKGATGGLTDIRILKASGTATILFGNDLGDIQDGKNIAANITHRHNLSGVIKVSGSGTLVLAIQGQSAGSNSTVAIGTGQLYALVIRGTG